MPEENSDSIKVREGEEAEIVVKSGDRTFKYSRGEDGKLHIVEASGLKNKDAPKLLDRLLSANPKNCIRCLEAELSSDLTMMLVASLLEEEDFCDF